MSRNLLVANWKMHTTVKEAINLATSVREGIKNSNFSIVLCPPFTALTEVGKIILGTSTKLGAQDIHWENQGAFTGEISPLQLLDLGVEYVIVGHSERRIHLQENDTIINLKLKSALKNGLTPILCVGETLKERESNQQEKVVEHQLEIALQDLKDLTDLVIAYEPVWAIGTGVNATPQEAQRMHCFIKSILKIQYKKELSVLYGGSVNPENISQLVREVDIDGALIGNCSLDAARFLAIVESANNSKPIKK